MSMLVMIQHFQQPYFCMIFLFGLFVDLSLLIFLGILWTVDLVETITLVHKKGLCVEANPFARFLLKHSDMDFIIFKAIDFIFLAFILFFVSKSYMAVSETMLLIFIGIYIFTVVHNKKIMQKYGC